MSIRNRLPRHADSYRGSRDGPRPVLNRGPAPFPVHPAALEEEVEICRGEIQRIVSENRHFVDDNTILLREFSAAKEEIHRLGQVIPKLRSNRETQARELAERGLKLEAELRACEPLRVEVLQLRAEAQKLNALQQDLASQVQTLTKDITRAQAENRQINVLKSDMDGMHKELMETRRAFEYEKKANEEQLDQKDAMEKNLISMAREVEKLRAEMLNADRALGHGSGGYGMLNRSPEMRYPGGGYADGYGGSWGSYPKRPRH